MATFPIEWQTELELTRKAIESYGKLHADLWRADQAEQLRAEVLSHDRQPAWKRFIARFFTTRQPERKRAWLCYHDSLKLLQTLEAPEFDLAHFQSFVAGEASTQILRLSYFSRLRSPVRKLLALIKRAVSHLTTTLVVSSAAYVPPPVTDTAPPPSLDANPKAAVEASKLTAAAEFDFASELEAFSVLCKQSSITKEEVRREYRRLAPKFHPDHAGFDNTHNFQALSACYTNYLNPVEALDPVWVAAERADIEQRVANFEKAQAKKLTEFRVDHSAQLGALRADTDAACTELRADTDTACAALRAETAVARSEIGGACAELRANTDAACTELRANTDAACTELRANTDAACTELKAKTAEARTETGRACTEHENKTNKRLYALCRLMKVNPALLNDDDANTTSSEEAIPTTRALSPVSGV